ncbi:MAG: hypothetical protein IPG66_02785 [Hydrogenophilales bacterium]|nr:hypothetical protein [Hydrogenophilales bacterium]
MHAFMRLARTLADSRRLIAVPDGGTCIQTVRTARISRFASNRCQGGLQQGYFRGQPLRITVTSDSWPPKAIHPHPD